ncbi:hypothetical protein [Nocardia terpenica]|uniref:hypothetical protein n=1 Tax=Nocardia terpenica TaxID=455432 RepID=UPI001583771A|nr:hypothetical protein [Nocardia terpenica]
MSRNPLGDSRSGHYLGAHATDLRTTPATDRVSGMISQRSLFTYRGVVEFEGDALVLRDWWGDRDLVLRRSYILTVRREFTELYGKFVGGLFDSGKPLIIDTTLVGEIYLLIDRREFLDTTANAAWERLIEDWRTPGPRPTGLAGAPEPAPRRAWEQARRQRNSRPFGRGRRL